MALRNLTSAVTEVITFQTGFDWCAATVTLQVHGNAWTGTLVIATRVAGSGLPFRNAPYQNLETLADVAAGTTITTDGQFAVRVDGEEVQVTHTRSAGSVDLSLKSVRG